VADEAFYWKAKVKRPKGFSPRLITHGILAETEDDCRDAALIVCGSEIIKITKVGKVDSFCHCSQIG
jgi:hypothetical protein